MVAAGLLDDSRVMLPRLNKLIERLVKADAASSSSSSAAAAAPPAAAEHDAPKEAVN